MVNFIRMVIMIQGKWYRLRKGLRILNHFNVCGRLVHSFQANRPYLRFWANWSCFRNIFICLGDSPLARVNSPRMFPLKQRRAALEAVIKRRKIAVIISLKFIVGSKVFVVNFFEMKFDFWLKCFILTPLYLNLYRWKYEKLFWRTTSPNF